MKERSHVPHSSIHDDFEDHPTLPKSPLRDTFPEECPPNCSRECKKFYQAHTKLVSFAMYATQNPKWEPRLICVYAFSCGKEREGEKFTLERGETPEQLLLRVVPALLRSFSEEALEDKAEDGIRDN